MEKSEVGWTLGGMGRWVHPLQQSFGKPVFSEKGRCQFNKIIHNHQKKQESFSSQDSLRAVKTNLSILAPIPAFMLPA